MIDLHTHSRCSDGSDAPGRIPELAAQAGLSAVALTDHDRLDGLEEAEASARRVGVRLVPGCEVSCAWQGGSCHVLVYFVGPGEGPLQDELVRLLEDRRRRNQEMLAKLATAGITITEDELVAEAGGDGSGAGRPHVASILRARGIVDSTQEAFDRWLTPGCPGYVPKARVAPEHVSSLARASGGLAVLAHPLTLGLEPPALEGAMAELGEAGFAGMEAYYGRYSPQQRSDLVSMANRLGLVPTGGSDHHGEYKPDLSVGVGQGDLEVPDAALEALGDRLP